MGETLVLSPWACQDRLPANLNVLQSHLWLPNRFFSLLPYAITSERCHSMAILLKKEMRKL